jgi:signal transduction histidine kinase
MHPFPSEDALHVLMALPSGIVIFNRQDRIAFVNPAAVQLLNWDYDRLIGLDREAFCLQFAIPFELGAEPAAVEINNCSYQIQHVPFGQPTRQSNLLSQYIFHRETLNIEKMACILSRLSYELIPSISSLGGSIDRLETEFSGVEQKLFTDVRRLETNLIDAVMQYRLFGALMEGSLWLDQSPFDFTELLCESIQRYSQIYNDRDITLTAQIPQNPLHLINDAHYFQLAIEQVLDNAFRYTLPGGEIRLSVEVSGTTLTLHIGNPGMAFSSEAQTQLFRDQPHILPEPPLLRQGTGLGLMIAARLLNLLGGTIAYSYKPEGFLVFEMTLPGGGIVAGRPLSRTLCDQ